jgi:hypothetical protein
MIFVGDLDETLDLPDASPRHSQNYPVDPRNIATRPTPIERRNNVCTFGLGEP